MGDVAVRVDDGDDPIIWLTTPPIEKLVEYPRERCAAMLGLQSDQLVADVPCELLSAGVPMIFVAVDSPATVDQARLDAAVFEQIVNDRSTPTMRVRLRSYRCRSVFAHVCDHSSASQKIRQRAVLPVHWRSL